MLFVTSYLIPSGFVGRHVSLQLRAVCKGVAALGAAEAFLGLLVPIFDVFLQGAVTLVATRAVRTGEQLREGVWSSWMEKKESVVMTYMRVEGRVKNTWSTERAL